MFRTAAPARRPFGARLKIGTSLTALALAVSLAPLAAPAARAQTAPQPFGTMVGMQAGRVTLPNGQLSQWTGARAPVIGTDTDGRPLMTIEQTQAKALLDWEDFRLKTNEVLEFKQQSADWIAVNRVHGNQAAEINGEIRAIGKVFVFNDNGVLIGKDAKINTRTLVTGRGFSDVLIDGKTTTLVQSKEKALLNWSDMSTQAGEVLRFQQQKSDWIALNRSYNTGVTKLQGDIKADGNIYLVAPRGLSVEGKVDAQQVVLSSLFMRDDQFFGTAEGSGLMSFARDYNDRMDPTFSNTWIYRMGTAGYNPLGAATGVGGANYYDLIDTPPQAADANDPLKYNVTVGRNAVITTGKYGKVILAGPKVTNKGKINVFDDGQVILAAGENIYLTAGTRPGMLEAYSGAYNPMLFMRANIPYQRPPQTITSQDWLDFYEYLLKKDLNLGQTLSSADWTTVSNLIIPTLNDLQARRAREVNYTARNEGIISAKRGGNVTFVGLNLEQMGAVDITSTALFRGDIAFRSVVYDWREYVNNDGDGPMVTGNGSVVFGKGSLTQITPDLDSKDAIPLTEGKQSVGSLRINARDVHMQEDALIYMPGGTMNVLLDAAVHVFSAGGMFPNRGNGANQGNEDGTRFMMERGATIDLSGWKSILLPMGYHQVSGKLFAAQLADSPLQRDGVLYRKEISVDRRFGTNLANWNSFDNLTQGTLAQFLTDGGTLTLDVGDDFIMKAGSVIDVSGGVTTYQDGYVYTTMLRRLDGSVIDIREADPDELYMGLANEWTVYDTKWGKQTSYYIPLMSSARGRYETSYQQGGAGGKIEILAPDVLLQGTLKGETVAGRYQRSNAPKGGSFILNSSGETEGEYVSNNILITAREQILAANFGFRDKLSDSFGDLFGKEYDRNTDPISTDGRRFDNTTLTSADFFNRSTMGSYELNQGGRIVESGAGFPPADGIAVKVEEGVNLNLKNGASLTIAADQRMEFLGSIRTEGGDVALSGLSLVLGNKTRIDTRGSWYSDYEISESVDINNVPRIDGGNISLRVATIRDPQQAVPKNVQLWLPDTVVLDASGGAWIDRKGKLTGGKGGDLSFFIDVNPQDTVELGGLAKARAYGLGGNGKFNLTFGDDIVIGDALTPQQAAQAGRTPMLFRPDFFENSGFSALSFMARSVTVNEGAQVHLSAATLQLSEQSLNNGVLPAYYAPSGTDIYSVAEIVSLPQAQRPALLRRGMDLSIAGQFNVGKDSLLATEIGGRITVAGGANIQGTILAPAGLISVLNQVSPSSNTQIVIGSTGRLLAPGASLITWRGLNSEGRELVDGVIYDGGRIELTADRITLAQGSLLDVSGTRATFDIQVSNEAGGVARIPVTLESNGGGISLYGSNLDINNATWKANAGGDSASGGDLSLSWANQLPAATGTFNPASIYSFFNTSRSWYLKGSNTRITTRLWGVDLSTIDFQRTLNAGGTKFANVIFPVGYKVNAQADLEVLFQPYTQLGGPVPPFIAIGETFTPQYQAPTLPVVPEPIKNLVFAQLNLTLPVPVGGTPPVTVLTTGKIAEGGFSNLNLSSLLGFTFNGNVNLGGKKADGSYVFDTISLTAPVIVGTAGTKVNLEAGVVNLSTGLASAPAAYIKAIGDYGVKDINAGAVIDIKAGTLLQVAAANFHGFENTNLTSGGDIRFSGISTGIQGTRPTGILTVPGNLTLKADQVYAGTGRVFTVTVGKTLEIRAQDDGGPINGSPYEAAADLTMKAARIVQGGTLRSPLGTLSLIAPDNGTPGAGEIILKAGSLTSVSADGRMIPYGYTSNGDTWTDPFTGLELTTLPAKTVSLTADVLDLQTGSVLDVSGGGDLFAREFVPGIGGTTDWLTGYRDENYNWVSAPGAIYAVMPDYEGNIAPLGFGSSQIGVGDKVYLSGGSGLPAGYYTLLPAEYALLPGAYRVTANHRYGDSFSDARLGEIQNLTDGSSIQSGYRIEGASGAREQRSSGWHVMPGATLRERSFYRETTANAFFTSEAFLKKALRVNRPVTTVPRTPLDGGSVVFKIAENLNLQGTLNSKAGQGGRGGFADIDAPKIVVAGANTDLSQYTGYLVLKTEQLNNFGAESLLIGGVRRQGVANLELSVSGTDVVIDNSGTTLFGPELLFASTGNLNVRTGARLETRGQISGSSGDLRILPSTPVFIDDKGTPTNATDDVTVHGLLDQGALLRLSSGEQVDILRNADAVDAMARLRNDPAALASINALRVSKGLAPLDVSKGVLTIDAGATLNSSRSVALDATNDTRLNAAASLQTRQLSAAASRVSLGNVPAGTSGLVFAGLSTGMLTQAEDLILKSYGTIDIYGTVELKSTQNLSLDTRNLRVMGTGSAATLTANTLSLTNSNGGTATAVAGSGTLTLNARNVYFEGGDKWVSGVDRLNINAQERVIGRDDGTLYVPGLLNISAGGLTADSGARLFLDATSAIKVTHNGNNSLPVFQSFGGTLGLTGASIDYAGQTRMTGGNLQLRARTGDVVLSQGSLLDVTANVARFYEATQGVSAGTVTLVADRGNVELAQGAEIDVSGAAGGGNAGSLSISTGLGEARLNGRIKGSAAAGARSGSFTLLTQSLPGFAALNATLDTGGFRESRRFEINSGDLTLSGTVNVANFTAIANDGAINLTGTIDSRGASGGRIQLSAAKSVTLGATGKLLASATAADGAGGTVIVETSGRGGGTITSAAGSLIDVSGTGEGGRLVRFRAPQIGNDVAIGQLSGTVTGARSVIAEAYRVYDNVSLIDQGVINQVSGDATAFMNANAAAIRSRLGADVTLAAGIELRNAGDMELKQNWDLSTLRFNGAAGVLTLRAGGDLKINANLGDGFTGTSLLTGDSWSFNLTAGANLLSPDSMATLPQGQLAAGKGSVMIGGKADTIEYYYDATRGNENRLYLLDPTGRFIRGTGAGTSAGFVELTRNAAGKYLNPVTGAVIEKNPVTGDYDDTLDYARRPLPWIYISNSGVATYRADTSLGSVNSDGIGNVSTDLRPYIQYNNSTGYYVRTGTGTINVSSGRDLVLQERASVIYTAGRQAAALAGFSAPVGSNYGIGGGDLTFDISGDILASMTTPQLPSGYLAQAGTLNNTTGLFNANVAGRASDSTTWWVDYALFQGGLGALGGGNITLEAGGDIRNLGVAIPNSGRVTGNTVKLANGTNEATRLTLTGGGDLRLTAGGNLYGGLFYVADGAGDLTFGGSVEKGSVVYAQPAVSCSTQVPCYPHQDFRLTAPRYDLYTMLFTSSGQFDVKAGGDLNIDSVMDPLLSGAGDNSDWKFISYTKDAGVRLFSAGGNVTLWNNGLNISLAYLASGRTRAYAGFEPLLTYGTTERPVNGRDSISWDLYPSKVAAIAANGDVRVLGGMTILPDANAQLDLLAGGNVYIGYGTQALDPYLLGFNVLGDFAKNQRGVYQGIYLSQSDMTLFRTPTNQYLAGSIATGTVARIGFRYAGQGGHYPGFMPFSSTYAPDLYQGNTEPVRIYAVKGDIVTSTRAELNIPKQLWIQAGGNIYFPSYSIQHNNPNDLSLVRAGKGIYFDIPAVLGGGNDGYTMNFGHLTVRGPGRLEVEAGTDIWLPSNGSGITSARVLVQAPNASTTTSLPAPTEWRPEEKAADIAISTGFNQKPAYDAFEAAYLDPAKAGEMKDFLKDETGKSLYLFDREYARAEGATGEFATPEPREGLVNYVRRLQGLQPLTTKAEQVAYLDTAWAYWKTMGTDYKTPFYRSVLFLELRTTGREANDADNDRYNTTFRGYDAIATLFPGAQKSKDQALAEGESRWRGDFQTYASRVMSFGGGKIEFVVPGGEMTMADVAAKPAETGQPAYVGDRGNALRAGIVTTDGGEVNVLAHDSVTLNQSRLLTTKGGNVMIWSSWGDIAAGKGAKTSISPSFFNYKLDTYGRMVREPAGLPTGAGIGTLATQEGTPPADVDLIAPAGIVDAGDAGIRVSGNFNVFAIQILGTDNIEVAGVSTGLPVPPAAPPTSLDVDVSSRSNLVDKALQDAVSQVQKNKGIVSPSLIEVKAVEPDTTEPVCQPGVDGTDDCAGTQSLAPSSGPVDVAEVRGTPVKAPVVKVQFDIPAQPIDDTVRQIGQSSDMTILYDSEILKKRMGEAVSGRMTPEEALARVLLKDGVEVIRVGPKSIMLKKGHS